MALVASDGMENVDVQMFDDAGLKSALRRHYSCAEGCPNHLRQRIQTLLHDPASSAPPAAASPSFRLTAFPAEHLEPAVAAATAVAIAQQASNTTATTANTTTNTLASTASTTTRWWASSRPRLAVAAGMLVAIGAVTLLLARSSQAVPESLQIAAVTRHDRCCQHATHRSPEIPQENFAMLGQYLRGELKYPVLAADMRRENWHFRGAAICPVGEVKSAHLLFDQDGRTLSVFSLPASSFPSLQDHKTYSSTTADGHVLVAEREGAAIYCLVEQDPSGHSRTSDLQQMLKDHQQDAAVAAAPPASAGKLVRFATSVEQE
jgi:hypothetical protein